MKSSKVIKQTKPLNPKDVRKQWFLIDAEDVVLGRLASNVSKILRGKHKANYTPHVDCGDNVIIINAEKVKLTGNKLSGKKYYWHTGYPGGIKETTAKKIIEGKNPDKIIRLAVQRMIPKGPLGRQQISNMKVYCGESHPHDSQAPKKFNIIDMV